MTASVVSRVANLDVTLNPTPTGFAGACRVEYCVR